VERAKSRNRSRVRSKVEQVISSDRNKFQTTGITIRNGRVVTAISDAVLVQSSLG